MFQPKLNLPPGAVLPASFDESHGRIPSDSFIVSRGRFGEPKSLFKDLAWDFSAYNPEGKLETLYFNFWGKLPPTSSQLELSVDTRCIVFCLIWRRAGAPLSSGTLRNYISVLNAIAHYADGIARSIGQIFSDRTLLTDFILTRCSGWMAETLCSLLSLLANIGPAALGFHVVDDHFIKEMQSRNKAYRASIKQHPPMPTRIYSKFISGLQKELAEWRTVADDLLAAALECGKDPRAGRSRKRQEIIGKAYNLPSQKFFVLDEIIDERSRAYFLVRGKPINPGSLSVLIGQAQYMAKLTIQTFTGMRDDEVTNLPYHCSTTTVSSGTKHHLVLGRTTKFSHGLAKRTQWVTNKEGHDAIQVAQQIANVIYDVYKVTPSDLPQRMNSHPLFVAVGYLRFAGIPTTPEDGHFIPGSMNHRDLPQACISVIEDEDLRELEYIEPHRAWRTEDKFKVGIPWTFTSHQTRRSLALYAQRSGLVSLPSLRRQLKHITEEMSRYYAKGSAFAKNFIGGDRNHFGTEWQATQVESSALSYILNVLTTDDVLFGGHANWVQQRMTKPDGIILVDRSETMKRFKKGELAYRETILGGCTNLGTCDKVAVHWLHTTCVAENCKNLVGNLRKLDLVIAAQTNLVDGLDKESIEFRTESQDLETLVAMRGHVMANKGVS